jgi:hypothetical protein
MRWRRAHLYSDQRRKLSPYSKRVIPCRVHDVLGTDALRGQFCAHRQIMAIEFEPRPGVDPSTSPARRSGEDLVPHQKPTYLKCISDCPSTHIRISIGETLIISIEGTKWPFFTSERRQLRSTVPCRTHSRGVMGVSVETTTYPWVAF